MTAVPRIYIASLLDYNHGVYHGVWLSAENEPAILGVEVRSMLDRSPTAHALGVRAEDWAIHDYKGFDEERISEGAGLRRAHNLACQVVERRRAE